MSYTEEVETSHACPGTCRTNVSRRRLACARCWRRLPLELQTRFHTSRWAGDHNGHAAAVRAATRWLNVHPDERQGGYRVW